ncbi:MAG: tetraacyldisaccharide 4'-kinase [Terriglobales bacterium]
MNPFTGIYGAASALRNSLFDHGTLPAKRLQRPVVSVGNLSVGGAGKTPFVIALGEMLKARGIRFDVLSRGYGRKTRGALVVEANGGATDFGDEPLLITRRLDVPVVVGESRYAAGQLAEAKFASQVHILDDGFQHRSLARDFDIVLVSDRDFEDRLLPSGRLREPLASLARAHAIVLPSESAAAHPALQGKLIWRVKREIVIANAPASPVVFCGIAHPEQFFAQVRAAGIQPVAEIAFRDHHRYNQRDIEKLLAASTQRSAGGFLTTEKDAVNFGQLQESLKPLVLAVLNTAPAPSDIVDTILNRIGILSPQS